MAYTVVKNYKATKSDEIGVNMGSVVEVLQKAENGWWLIRWATSTKLRLKCGRTQMMSPSGISVGTC